MSNSYKNQEKSPQNNSHPTRDRRLAQKDGVNDGVEKADGTDPLNADSDGDGFNARHQYFLNDKKTMSSFSSRFIEIVKSAKNILDEKTNFDPAPKQIQFSKDLISALSEAVLLAKDQFLLMCCIEGDHSVKTYLSDEDTKKFFENRAVSISKAMAFISLSCRR